MSSDAGSTTRALTPAALTGKRHRPTHRAPRNTHRGAVAAAGVLVALGAAATTFALVGPGGMGLGSGLGGDTDLGASRAPAQEPGLTEPSPVAGEARVRTCWDGAEVAAVKDCGVPSGRDGLATVFAGLDADCAAARPKVAGKVEVFTCTSSDHVVRYTRWTAGYDRFAYFDDEHSDQGGRWLVDGDFAGRTWTASDVTADGVTHYLWTATYRAWPLSVEVQSTTAKGRAAGVAEVAAVAPGVVGLQ